MVEEGRELAGDFEEAERGTGTAIEACRDEICRFRGSFGEAVVGEEEGLGREEKKLGRGGG